MIALPRPPGENNFSGHQYLKQRRSVNWGTTFRSYSEPLRTLNVERLLFSPPLGA